MSEGGGEQPDEGQALPGAEQARPAEQAMQAMPASPPGGKRYVQVALSLPLGKEFSYSLPKGVVARPGNRVRVPFRGRERSGIVVAVSDTIDFDPAKVLDICSVVDGRSLLPDALLQLARRMAREYGCSLGEALDAMVPAMAKRRGKKRIPSVALNVPHDIARVAVAELEEKRQAQSRVLRAVLEYGAEMPIRQLRRLTDTSDSPWQTLVKHGILKRCDVEEEGQPLVPLLSERAERHELNQEQAEAVDSVLESVRARRHQVYLLHGITGSGKTEVYLRVLEEVRQQGRTAIVLVPEIALTPQTVGRFASRFVDVAVLHSGLTEAQRGREWQRLVSGEANIAIGARSALFAPLRNLGLIVVDEEHEGTFKQESTPRYHARAMAIARGEIEGAAVVLGSATPSLESYGRAKRGSYRLLRLRQRAGQGELPRILIEDLRHAGKEAMVEGVMFSRTLRNLMAERLQARDQIILFLNRRGFAPVLMCPACGEVVKCRRCEVSMTFHGRRQRLVCHYCREEQKRPEACPVCSHDKFHDLGAGTERVERAVRKLFPEAAVVRMDADTMTERGAHERTLTKFRQRQIDVLIGTQMIAKGLDFPDVTLVGVISADSGLFLPDYRAAERSFQLLYQVAGRAGRAEKPGMVVFQTFCPNNYAVQAAMKIDYESFVKQELGFRRSLGYPPYSRLVRVLVEGQNEMAVKKTVRSIHGLLLGIDDLEALGPAPAVISRVKGRHRVHCLAKCKTETAFGVCMSKLENVESRTRQNLRVTLDVDPGSLL